jgi:type I restriction enzyme S subunit
MRYVSYKDTEIDWLGKIPATWNVERIKNIGSVNGRVGWKALKASEYVESGFFFLSTPNIKEVEIDFVNVNYITAERYYESPEIMLEVGDILLVKDGSTLGIVNVIRQLPAKGTVNSSIAVLRVKKFHAVYGYYFLLSNYIQNVIQLKKDGMGVPHLFQKDINNFEILVPSLEEQTTIANYLDTKTQGIDKKISLLKKKIGYYQELRKSLINETVTKGLDKNEKFQTNELGFDTPKNWLRYRLKDLGTLYSGLSGKSGDDFNQDDNPNNQGFIPFTNIANNTYLKRDHLGTVLVYEGEKQNRVRRGDIFFLMSSEGYEDIGKSAALAEDIEETYLNSFCKGYRVNPRKTNPYFLNYLMLSGYYRQLLIVEGKGFTRINLKMEKVNDFLVYIPDTLSAQEEIVKFLDAKLDTIDQIITNLQTQITTLKELRKTLINDVVTGKIKVTQG